MAAPRIWINAGEASGDLHGALLAKALGRLAPEVRISGMGGGELLAAGQKQCAHIDELSVMGFTEVLGQLPKILRLLGRIKTELRRTRPDVVVCIDSPDFNFRLVRMANALNIPVVYYISPKIWAWRKGRARFIKRHVERMLCILPFEVEFYRGFDVPVQYVGNPLLDAIDWGALRDVTPDPLQVGLLPGSRRKEIESLLPEFALAARELGQRLPGLRFPVGRAPNVPEERIRELWPDDLPLDIVEPEDRYRMMRGSAMLLCASGTVTLESALLGTPTIVAYKLSPLTFALARRVVRVPFISLPNLILGKGVFPEHLQKDASGRVLATAAMRWLGNPAELERVRAELARLHPLLGRKGAPLRAAQAVLEVCGLDVQAPEGAAPEISLDIRSDAAPPRGDT